jgi:dephospho-CoA kinase
MSKKKIKIAITGNIGSGKSTFSHFIESAGYKVIYADNVSKSLLENHSHIKKKIIASFGQDSYINNKPNKKFLADTVFQDPKKLAVLESILHPEVIKLSIEMMEEHLKNNDVIFLEAALIYEADMEKYFDYVVLITADKETRFNRKKLIEDYTREEFIERENLQIPQDEKRKRADFIFENNSDLNSLKQKADLLFSLLGFSLPNNV